MAVTDLYRLRKHIWLSMEFYQAGYNVFVLEYTVNPLDEAPLKLQPLNDISRAMRMIRFRAEQLHVLSNRIVVCGFSAGGHLCASLCVHGKDIKDSDEKYQKFSNKPDAAVLSYPVITSGKYAHRDSFVALLGKNSTKKELEYMSIEKYVTKKYHHVSFGRQQRMEPFRYRIAILLAQKIVWKKEFHLRTHSIFRRAYMECLLQQRTGWNAEEDSLILQEQLSYACRSDSCGKKLHFLKEKGEELTCDKMGLEEHSHRNGTAEQKEEIRKTLKEVQIWPKLAEEWLEKIIDYKGEA